MLISVAIPAFNEEKLLGETLAAVDAAGAAFRTRGWKMEVMVCDNNSTDRTAAIAEAAGARVVFEAENQISRSRNAAGNAARGDWIIFLDADSTPCEGLFAATADLMETESTLGGGVVIRMESMPWWAAIGLGIWNLISRVFRWPAGSYIFCRAEAFRELEGFSPKLYAAEEIEFDHRLKRLARQRQQRDSHHPPSAAAFLEPPDGDVFTLPAVVVHARLHLHSGLQPPPARNVQLVVRWPALSAHGLATRPLQEFFQIPFTRGLRQ